MDQEQQVDRNGVVRERRVYNQELVEALETELSQIDEAHLPTVYNYLSYEISKLKNGVTDFLEMQGNKKCKVRAKIIVPDIGESGSLVVSKLIGPGGSTLKTLQETSQTKMSILGAGSMRNREKEQELLNSGDPKYRHFKGPLHLQIEALADPSEAYYRISHALAEVKSYFEIEYQQPMAMGGGGMRGRGGFAGRGRGAPTGMLADPVPYQGDMSGGYVQQDQGFGNGYQNYGGGAGGKMRGGGRGGGAPQRGSDKPYSRRPGRGRA